MNLPLPWHDRRSTLQTRIQTHSRPEREEIVSRAGKGAFAALRVCCPHFICSCSQPRITFCVKQPSASVPHSCAGSQQPWLGLAWLGSPGSSPLLVTAGCHPARAASPSKGRAGQSQPCQAGSSLWTLSHSQTGVHSRLLFCREIHLWLLSSSV